MAKSHTSRCFLLGDRAGLKTLPLHFLLLLLSPMARGLVVLFKSELEWLWSGSFASEVKSSLSVILINSR